MENISEIISHFNFTQTRKSKQYLASFFNQKTFNKNQTLYTQQKLKMFLENFQLINDYKSSENIISSIQKFLGEVNTDNYNLLTKIMYGEFINQTNNNITLFIEFSYRFGVLLKSFQKSNFCKDYSNEIEKNIQFIDSLSVNENLIENYLVNNKNIMLLHLESFLTENNLTFTYKLKEGWSKMEIGKILFDKHGLNDLLKQNYQ